MQVELDDQAALFDDMGREMDTAESRTQAVMKKIAKVMHLSNDKRQWTVIGILIGAIIFILFLFAIL
jgi:syntaxin 6